MGAIRTLGIADVHVHVHEISGVPRTKGCIVIIHVLCLALTTATQQRLIALGFARPFNFTCIYLHTCRYEYVCEYTEGSLHVCVVFENIS